MKESKKGRKREEWKGGRELSNNGTGQEQKGGSKARKEKEGRREGKIWCESSLREG